MLNIYKVFILFSTIIFISNSELSEEIKKNIKFVCGESVVIGGGSGHIDGPGDFMKAVVKEPLPRNFTVKKSITKEDNLTMIYEGQCGVRMFNSPEPMNICDTMDSQSDDEKTNLYKAFIDLLGFNVSNCPIPEGTYTLKQQNDFNPWLSDFFGSECNKHDLTSNYGLLSLHLMDGNDVLMIPSWHQIKLNGTDNCSALGSIIRKSVPDTFNPDGEFIEEVKKNMKFVCGEAIVVGGGSGHIDGPGNRLAAIQRDSFPINFTVKGTYTLKQQNDFNPWLSDFFGSECSKYDLTSNYGSLTLNLIDGNHLSMIPEWLQIQLNGTDNNCSALARLNHGSIIRKSVPDTS